MTLPNWGEIDRTIAEATGLPFQSQSRHSVGGGCINTAYAIAGNGRKYFVKINGAEKYAMFEAEADGLAALGERGTVKVPRALCWGVAGSASFLVLEYLDLRASGDSAAAERFGRELAATHRCTGDGFGWHMDNTIGATPQINRAGSDWVAFFRRHRLEFQLDLAFNHGYRGDIQHKGRELASRLPGLFGEYRPQPSLLHGDLWAGNYATDAGGHPVMFDPAVYRGDREADLAMTELFGGFPARFYAAYREAWPLDTGYSVRKTLYNLYHVLNHLNLFGSGYEAQAERMMDLLLSELR